MTKRILVTLDYDAETPVATEYAIEIARRHGAEVTGLALVDTRELASDTRGGGIGAMYYAEKLREQLSSRAREQAQDLLVRFGRQLDAAAIPHSRDHIEEGVPFERIEEDMRVHDLLVTGRESHYYYLDPDKRTHALNDVVKHGAAATLVVGAAYQPIRRVLLAYDGGLVAARAMQRFAQLAPFGTDLEVEVLHVRGSDADDERDASELRLGLAQHYLEAHGFGRVTATSLVSSEVADRVASHARETGADLIVAGAYSRSGISRFFFGSTASHLVDVAETALFLYH